MRSISRAGWILAALLPLIALDAAAQRRPNVQGGSRLDTVPRLSPADTVRGLRGEGQRRGARQEAEREEAGVAVDPAVDSVLTALRRLEGYVATEYEGERAIYHVDEGVLRLQGNSRVVRNGNRLTAADSIVYRERRQLVEAYGEPTVRGEQQELEGEVLYYDLARSRATALGARTQVSEGAVWYVRGDVTLEESERLYATRGTFTTDDRPEPQYHFESDRIKIVRDRVLVAAPARLYFGKVPVAWFPFIVQDLERGRRSGILTPDFGINDIFRSSGDTREIRNLGFYWAINDYLGAQLTGQWRSGTYTSLRGTLDWNWRRQFLSGTASLQQYWQQTGNTQLALNGSSSWKPDERTNLSASANYASSSQFIREISADPREVTQQLASNLRVARRFDWGNVSVGATRRQNVTDGSVDGTFPSFSINPNTVTLFRAPTPEQARWYSNASLQVGVDGTRSFREGLVDFDRRLQDEDKLELRGGLKQFSIGNFSLSATGAVNQRLLQGATGLDASGDEVELTRRNDDLVTWQSSISYRQSLIGQTVLSPNLSLNQELRRDSITGADLVGAPVRMNFGASMSSALFGFYPGVGSFSSIRHRLSPRISYSYSPRVEQTALQEAVFGQSGGRTRNRVTLSLNQTWEAKLRDRPAESREERDAAAADTAGAAPEAPADTTEAADPEAAEGEERESERAEPGAGDPAQGEEGSRESLGADDPSGDAAGAGQRSQPAEARKVTLLSIDSSPLEYDFARAAEEGNGFVTSRLSNSVSSDFLRGLTVRMEHELFDRRELDPDDPATRGRLGIFAPRLSSLGTSFTLGPNSAVVQWIQNVLAIGEQNDPAEGMLPGSQERDPVHPEGTGAATNNPRGTGGGPWRVSLDYRFRRPERTFSRGFASSDETVQTVGAQMSFALTPNWAVTWTTDYSLTDREFGSHRLVLRRDLYRWEADFSFNQSPYGNSSFHVLVRLKDLPELKFQHRENNLQIDRNRR